MLTEVADLPRRRWVGPQKLVGHPEGPQRNAGRSQEPSPVKSRDLQAAASQVELDPVDHGKAPHRPEEAIAGLLHPGQEPDLDAQLALHTLDERRPVRRVPKGRGSRGDQATHAGAPSHRTEVPQRLEGPLQRRRGDGPFSSQVSNQTKRGPAPGEDPEMAPGLLVIDDDAARVRSDIDDGNGVAGLPSRPRWHILFSPPRGPVHSGRLAPASWLRPRGWGDATARKTAALPRATAGGCRRRCAARCSRW